MKKKSKKKKKQKQYDMSIVLAILALLTLLAAVAGASFAYFTFSSSVISGSTTFNVSIETPGSLTLTATTPTMHIRTTAVDFKTTNVGTYWSTATEADYVNNSESNVINTLAVTGGSNAETVYECTYSLAVVTTGLPATGMKSSGEYVVYITGIGETITLDMGNTSNRNKTYTVTRFVTSTTPKTLNAYAKLVNLNDTQNYLQDKTIVTTFTATGISCIAVASAGTDSIIDN